MTVSVSNSIFRNSFFSISFIYFPNNAKQIIKALPWKLEKLLNDYKINWNKEQQRLGCLQAHSQGHTFLVDFSATGVNSSIV